MNEDKKAIHGWLLEGEECLNCGNPRNIGDHFCSSCGQRAGRPTHFRAFLGDFLQDYFTFDSKIFRSLHPLILKPGFLVNEYLVGRRVRYIPPLRVFLFSSVLFFLFFGVGVGDSSEAVGRELDFFFDDILPKLVLLFVPLFALLNGWFFGKKGEFLKHFLFSTYLHSFVFILGIVYWFFSKLLQIVGAVELNPILFGLFIVALLMYTWAGLSNVYPRHKVLARMLRFVGMVTVYVGVLVLSGLIAVTILLSQSS